MDLDVFWGLVEDSAVVAPELAERRAVLTSRLAELAPADICDFEVHLTAARACVNTFSHWHAAYVLCDGLCSAERFFAFQSWVVGLGRSVLSAVASSPDALADVPSVRTLMAVGADSWPDGAWPMWDGLAEVAADAFFAATGRELEVWLAARGLVRVSEAGPFGPAWDLDSPLEAAVRLPRLWDLAGGLAEEAA